MEDYNEFKHRVKAFREKRGLRPADLAHRLGVTEGSIRHYESGETKTASLRVGLLMARALQVSPWYLAFGLEAHEVPDPLTVDSLRLAKLEMAEEQNLAEIAELRQHVQLLLDRAASKGATPAAPRKPAKRSPRA